MMKNSHGGFRNSFVTLLWLAVTVIPAASLSASELRDLTASEIGIGQTQVVLDFSAGVPPEARAFMIDGPLRLILDLPGVNNRLAQRTTSLNMGPLQSVTAVEAGARTRLIMNLNRDLDYQKEVHGNRLTLVLNTNRRDARSPAPPRTEPAAAPPPVPTPAPASPSPQVRPLPPTPVPEPAPVSAPESRSFASTDATPEQGHVGIRSARPPEIMNIDFRRGDNASGRVLINLSEADVSVDVQEFMDRVELTFPRVLIGDDLVRRMNVRDFDTLVSHIETRRERDDRVRTVIHVKASHEVSFYQTENQVVVEINPMPEDSQGLEIGQKVFMGERISLNFQDIEVRSVLQLLAEFTALNIVVSDTVSGNLTLRLTRVPWDQALDIVLRTRDLDKRVSGNVIYVAPSEEIAQRERRELESLRDREVLEPLVTEFISVNFTRANAIRDLLREHNQRQSRNEDSRLMTDRGNVSVDDRTNTLVVTATRDQVEIIRRLVQRLDVPTRQVLIETRVVIADDGFRRDLGMRFGVTGRRDGTGLSGSLEASQAVASSESDRLTLGEGGLQLGERLNIALPVPEASAMALTILRRNTLLDLELSALQVEGRGEIISSPRVITANGETATIKQGQEIPFLSVGDSGTQVEFRDAVLLTEVTPQITPNGNVIMNILVTKDEPDFSQTVQGNPLINKREVRTQVVVDNGETVVLGGVYEISSLNRVETIPFFGDLPVLGHLFRNRSTQSQRAELLIFVTPRILD